MSTSSIASICLLVTFGLAMMTEASAQTPPRIDDIVVIAKRLNPYSGGEGGMLNLSNPLQDVVNDNSSPYTMQPVQNLERVVVTANRVYNTVDDPSEQLAARNFAVLNEITGYFGLRSGPGQRIFFWRRVGPFHVIPCPECILG